MGIGSAHSSFTGYDPASRMAVAVQVNAANPGPAAVIGGEVRVTAKQANVSYPIVANEGRRSTFPLGTSVCSSTTGT